MDNKEKVLAKVKKLLALAGNNPSSTEAEAAMVKAHEILAEHKLSLSEVDIEDRVTIHRLVDYDTYLSTDWHWNLGKLIANNFACDLYKLGSSPMFLGKELDCEIARSIWKFAIQTIDKETRKLRAHYRKIGMPREGATGAYINGFIAGLKDKFNDQLKGQYALVLTVPLKEIEEYLEPIVALSGGLKTAKARTTKLSDDPYAWGKGYTEGKGLSTENKLSE